MWGRKKYRWEGAVGARLSAARWCLERERPGEKPQSSQTGPGEMRQRRQAPSTHQGEKGGSGGGRLGALEGPGGRAQNTGV